MRWPDAGGRQRSLTPQAFIAARFLHPRNIRWIFDAKLDHQLNIRPRAVGTDKRQTRANIAPARRSLSNCAKSEQEGCVFLQAAISKPILSFYAALAFGLMIQTGETSAAPLYVFGGDAIQGTETRPIVPIIEFTEADPVWDMFFNLTDVSQEFFLELYSIHSLRDVELQWTSLASPRQERWFIVQSGSTQRSTFSGAAD